MIRLWWLSFADPSRPPGEKFLGACIVPVPYTGDAREDMRQAISLSHLLQINPGGEVLASEMAEAATSVVSGIWVARILTREECEKFEAEHARYTRETEQMTFARLRYDKAVAFTCARCGQDKVSKNVYEYRSPDPEDDRRPVCNGCHGEVATLKKPPKNWAEMIKKAPRTN